METQSLQAITEVELLLLEKTYLGGIQPDLMSFSINFAFRQYDETHL